MATADPLGSSEDRTLAVIRAAQDAVRERAGGALEALILSGSHATGDAVWAESGGRAQCLSDLDLYAILSDERSCRSARLAAWTPEQTARFAHVGLLAPAEVAWLTREGLSQMTARPGTITLRGAGRLLCGDAAVLTLVPPVRAQDIDLEERLSLLENRGAELLGAAAGVSTATPESVWTARHATLKAALDLAGLLALESGEWPLQAGGRVLIAERRLLERPMLDPLAASAESADTLPGLWRRALAWRAAPSLPAAGQAEQEWLSVVRQWCRMWWRLVTPLHRASPEPWTAIRAVAARAPWPRRVRRAFSFRPRAGRLDGRFGHVLRAATGTPVHRLTGSITTLLFAAGATPSPACSGGAQRTLAALGVTSATEWRDAAHEVHDCWCRWVAGIEPGATR